MSRRTRNIYNKVVYTLLRILFFWSSRVEFFPDANGDSLTFRYGDFIYKYWSIPFLFRPRNFRAVASTHREIIARGLAEYIPRFQTFRWHITYEYIPQTRHLVRVLLEEPSTEKRIELLSRALTIVDKFHKAGILHGDLKPKNILVTPGGRMYVIDLEDAVVYADKNNLIDDYRKFIPRLIYLFTIEEIQKALDASSVSESLRRYIENYFVPFDARKIIENVDGLRFEHVEDIPNEDIDVIVQNISDLSVLTKQIEGAGLDYRIFFYSRNDIKLYAYNLSGVAEIDVHLVESIGRLEFMSKKAWRNPPVQIAVTGPDGIGKTTLLSLIHEHPNDELLARFPSRFIHAWRFAREGWIPPTGKWTLKERISARWRKSLFGRRVAYERFLRRNTAPLILIDRSFYDPCLQGNSLDFRLWPFWNLFFPRNVQTILLKAKPTTIVGRKPQLPIASIEEYYKRAEERLPRVVQMDAEGSVEESRELLERLIRFFVFTKKYFLP